MARTAAQHPAPWLNPAPDLLHHPHPGCEKAAAQKTSKQTLMSAYKSDFLNILAERGFIHQVSEPDALDALRQGRPDHRLYRLRLHGGLPACRLAAADHDALLDAADRPPADRADGRRHHAGRRPLRQGREPPHPDRRDDRAEPQRHPRDLFQVPEIRGRTAASRRDHGQQCRLAQQAQLHRFPARRRPAFLGQPHAVVRLGEDAARPPAGALVPRIQLHGAAGLRFRRTQQAHRLHFADGRLRSVGQHRQRHRSRPPHDERATVRADLRR